MGSRAWDVYKPRKMDLEVGRPNDARQVRSLPIFVHANPLFRPQKGQKEGYVSNLVRRPHSRNPSNRLLPDCSLKRGKGPRWLLKLNRDSRFFTTLVFHLIPFLRCDGFQEANILGRQDTGYRLSLCAGAEYLLQSPILFAAPQQEISTVGYPTGDERATLSSMDRSSMEQGHTTAIDGTCANCTGIKIKNIQINGTRLGATPTLEGPILRSVDLLQIKSSNMSDRMILEAGHNATIQNNDIGPCGSDLFQQWADGISVACANSVVRNNMVMNPTDGGSVLFGISWHPGVQQYNLGCKPTLLGGINMVDYDPWSGDYAGTVVHNNTMLGGFATDKPEGSETKGTNADDATMKIGVAIGPRTWFGAQYGTNLSRSGTVYDNRFSGAFSYAIAITSAINFTVQDNVLFGNTSFIDRNLTLRHVYAVRFPNITNGDSITCVAPPDGGDYWPGSTNSSGSGGGGTSTGAKVGIAIGVVAGVIAIALGAWFLRKWAIKRAESQRLFNSTRKSRYLKNF
ncbi:hypothetical protein F5146DRAFT_1223358 [Armillaria mellea]|nr:hypothetical protein F5146DRAFT_1223358 [Armillaria mellea]